MPGKVVNPLEEISCGLLFRHAMRRGGRRAAVKHMETGARLGFFREAVSVNERGSRVRAVVTFG